jgi:hypothetical protein
VGSTQAESLPPRQQPHRVRRTRLQSALVETVPPGMIHLKKALKSLVDLGDSVQLNFEDGSEVHADLVVGADGIRSVGPISIIIGIPHLHIKIVCQRQRVPRSHDEIHRHYHLENTCPAFEGSTFTGREHYHDLVVRQGWPCVHVTRR